MAWRRFGWVLAGLLPVVIMIRFGLFGAHPAARQRAAPVAAAVAAAPRWPAAGPCRPAPGFDGAAAQNAASLTTAAWDAFGRPETGWATYAPLTAHEIGTGCAPWSAGFAQALAGWQAAQRAPATGIMDEPTLQALKLALLRRRPFVAATAHGVCPPPPDPASLALARPDEGYGGKPVQLRAGALDAYRRMVAAARAEAAAIGADRQLLTILSGYRDPVSDAARCAVELDCGTIVRANCSAHRTGLAVDLYLGGAPGYSPVSAADANRLFQSQTPAYRWMVANAGRFGFVNYPFEPWHWEWTGEAP